MKKPEFTKKLLCCAGLIIMLSACGKKGPLIPPEALAPAPITDLRVSQKGEAFSICLTLPSTDQGGRSLQDLAGFQVLKRELLPPNEDCEECRDAYGQLELVDLEYLREVRRFGNLYCLSDPELLQGKSYRYKAVAISKDGTAGRDSNKVSRTFAPAPAPPALRASSSPTGVVLEWSAPPQAKPDSIVGFNIYRGESADAIPPFPLNGEPVQGNRYEDRSTVLGVTYFYAVRSVARVGNELVESDLSNAVRGELRFPEE